MKLSEIIKNCPGFDLQASGDAEVTSVEYDSRKITRGSLFVAVEGFVSDGHKYVSAAVAAGASAVVVNKSRSSEFLNLAVPVVATDDSRRALSRLAAYFYGDVTRKIPVIGITGTNGKTSTTYMMEAALRAGGYNPGIIGTVSYRWCGREIEAPNTTPESKDLHELLFNMRNDGVDVVVMEVSSHGLDLGRVDDIVFTGGVFTNLTRDHLDYHKTFESYFAAKKILFDLIENSPAQGKFACINYDDPYGRIILSESSKYSYAFASFGMNCEASYHPLAASVSMTVEGSDYRLITPDGDVDVRVPVGSRFSLYNSLAAFCACAMLSMKREVIAEGIAALSGVPGRFDRVASNSGFSVIVDYAHTNDAMEKLLTSVKDLNPKKVITVFGCGGDRDASKRPLMGEVAANYSDIVFVTSDNPRTENPDLIIADIVAGMGGHMHKTKVVPDRESAIREAVELASSGDIVVLAGKGHENYQIIGKEKRHFDDREMAAKYISIKEAR